jgi:hypothetical protein
MAPPVPGTPEVPESLPPQAYETVATPSDAIRIFRLDRTLGFRGFKG